MTFIEMQKLIEDRHRKMQEIDKRFHVDLYEAWDEFDYFTIDEDTIVFVVAGEFNADYCWSKPLKYFVMSEEEWEEAYIEEVIHPAIERKHKAVNEAKERRRREYLKLKKEFGD